MTANRLAIGLSPRKGDSPSAQRAKLDQARRKIAKVRGEFYANVRTLWALGTVNKARQPERDTGISPRHIDT